MKKSNFTKYKKNFEKGLGRDELIFKPKEVKRKNDSVCTTKV